MIRAALALFLFAGQAQALSCIPPDVRRSFQQASDAPESYVPATGLLRFDESRLPVTDWDNQQDTPQQTDIPARFTGHALGPDGFTIPFVRDITLRVHCYGPWCAGAVDGQSMFSFLEQTTAGYVLHIDPCASQSFANPGPELLETVVTCAQGGPCTPDIP